ncbi:methyl-accepting chemotaxis protein [uncultured Neptuniibacter sp.]|uniref:methyl-accepting chemotaxis protein n=1 Tax=uncultured Neptuniibacter sp. TaxID=502143 RepID=UPI002634A7F8|nr:methyl-accepting chemotaxis protein [uncultured Neptuniibacter sp.]
MKNMKFKNKLILLVSLPLLAFVILVGMTIVANVKLKSETDTLERLVGFVTKSSALVHELQKERGATAGFIGSKGSKFSSELSGQRSLTDEAQRAWGDYLTSVTIEDREINEIINKVKSQLSQKDTVRSRVDRLDISPKEAISFYTGLNKTLLSSASTVAKLSSDSEISRQTGGFYALLQSKERAGIERAVLSNVFAADYFASGLYERFLQLVSQQEAFSSQFLATASKEHVEFYNNALSVGAVNKVKEYRAIAKERSSMGGFNVESTEWFGQSTARINQLKKIENTLADSLIQRVVELNSIAKMTLLIESIIAIAVISVVIILAFWMSKLISAQVQSLSETMKTVRENGDLAVRADVLSEDELGQVAENLNTTLETFATAVGQIRTTSVQLSEGSSQTAATIEENSTNLSSQQQETSMLASAIEEMSSAVQEVANSTTAAAGSAQAAYELASDGVTVMRGSIETVHNLSEDVGQLNDLINRLNISSANISNVVNVINDVSEQTNLLALNAAIEAARAGDHGRGFSVVADEVRTLAQRTQASTTEIDTIIKQLQAEVAQADNMVAASKIRMDETLSSSEKMQSALEEINTSVSDISQMSTQIATAAEEQVAVITDVSRSVAQIDVSSEEIATGSQQISAQASSQADMSVELERLVNQFKV